MSEDTEQKEIQRRDDAQFQSDMKKLLQEAEDTRLGFMQQQRSRGFVSMSVGIMSILAGAGGFGWFFLVKYDILTAVLCMAGAIILPLVLHFWAEAPLKAYSKHYKSVFMPKMAKALGGFKFHPERGISSKLIARTGVIPPHTLYEAEDCFMGMYNGVKVIFSEARLYGKNNNQPPVFDGIFVLLEAPGKVIDGHTIITADENMVRQYASTRWKKLQTVPIQSDVTDWNNFQVFSDEPDAASLLIGERLQKELTEAAATFDNALMSTVLFREKFIFMAIPYEKDMFEASSAYIPVATKQHAMDCKKEIEQLLEIVDIFDLYKTKQPKNFAT